MQLYIGNKNYSSWSLRPWLLMKHAGIAFEEVPLRLDFDAASPFKTALAAVAPSGKVPVLVDDGFAVWDTLAIAEYLAEKFPGKALWPDATQARARARSLCTEMHGGFQSLRGACPMNIEADLPEVGAQLLRDDPGLAQDLTRIDNMWTQQLAASGGPFLFGAFSIVDAYYAPVVTRIRTYALPVAPAAAAYVERIFALPAMQQWVAAARAEHDFLPFDEPYRSQA
jgi:glutathione S-transferase